MDFVIFLKMYECILAFDYFEVLFAFLILKVFFLSIWTDQAILKKRIGLLWSVVLLLLSWLFRGHTVLTQCQKLLSVTALVTLKEV